MHTETLKHKILDAIHASYDMTDIENGFVHVFVEGDSVRVTASDHESAEADYNVDCRYEALHLEEHLAVQVEHALSGHN